MVGIAGITKVFAGSTPVQKVYAGTTLVADYAGAPMSSPKHSVFGGVRPTTLDRQNDGHGTAGIRIVTGFRRKSLGAGNWRILGGRFYSNTDTPAWSDSSFVLELWPTGTISQDLKVGSGKSPTASKAIPGTLAYNAHYDVLFDTPVTMPEATMFWLGYSNSTGDYVAANPQLDVTELQANDGSNLYMAGTDSPAAARGQFAYLDNSGDGNSGFWSGVDILVDEG